MVAPTYENRPMLSPLADRIYRHLLLAQVLSLLGAGVATVALGLLAYKLAGADAGAVLGTALAIKMAAYVGVAPVAGAFVHLVPRDCRESGGARLERVLSGR